MSLAREFQQYKTDAESTIKEASAGQGKALKGVSDLEKNNAQQQAQLLALAAEFQTYKEKTETKQRSSDAALEEAQGKLVGLVKEYGETMAECNAKLSQATETVEAHLRDKTVLQQEVGGLCLLAKFRYHPYLTLVIPL